MVPSILYLNAAPNDLIHGMKLAGIRRYAGTRRWEAESVSWQESRPEDIPRLLTAHQRHSPRQTFDYGRDRVEAWSLFR